MRMRRLILIEGMIGAGKSTMAERLAAMLTEEGRGVHAFHEFADNHPLGHYGLWQWRRCV